MKVCVVGGAGFVGSHVVDSLVEAGHEPVVVDNFFLGKMSNLPKDIKVYREDATKPIIMRAILRNENIDTVINLAMKNLPVSFVDPEGAYMEGVDICATLAYLLREKVYTRLIHFSSSECYGTAIYVPMDEKHPTNPQTPYSAGKLAADHLLLSYHYMFNLDVAIVRPFNFVGPRQNWGMYAAVVPQTIRRLLAGEKPFIEWDGHQTRDFTYVKDVTSYIPLLLKDEHFGNFRGKIVNFGQGKETTIKEVVDAICKEFDYPLDKIEYRPMRVGDVRRHCSDVSLAKKLIGYEPKISLKEAIHKTVEWFKQNYAEWEKG